MIRTKKFENLPQITSISPSGKIVITENGVDKVISFEDFSNLPPANDVWNNPSTTFTASEVNVTDIQSAADSKLLDLKVNTSSKFVVRKDGNLGIGVVNPAARLDISDTVLAGSGSLAGSILNLAQTWNTTGNPTAIKLNVTNTSSGATSNLLDLQVGGLTQFNVTKAGIIILNDNFGLRGVPSSGWIEIGGKTNILAGTSKVSIWEHILGLVQLANDGSFGWSSLSYASNGSTDLALARDAAGTLAQRNGVNPQAFRLYNTYTSSTNFERLNLRWDSNILKIGTEKGGAGGTARNLGFETDGTTRMTITSTGLVGIGTTNPAASLDIQGASSGIFLGRSDSEKYIYIVTSPSTGYTANSFAIWNGITAAWAGLIMQFTENAALIFNRDITSAYTQIRGANASEPALTLTQNSTGDFFAAGTFRLSKSGNLGIGNTVPAARLDIVDTWNSNISVTGATGTGSVATITFATQSTVIPVGATVVVSSVNPSGYNGTFVVTASTVTSISYTNSTSATYISGGLVKQQYDAIRVFVTDTNSDTNSNLLSLNLSTINVVGENWRYKVDKSGNLRSTGTHSIGIGLAGSASLDMGNGWYGFGGGNGIRILNNVTGYIFAHGDTQLWRGRDSVGAGINHILEQRNGTNGQTFNVYNTWSAWNNFERFSISAQNAANVIIGTNKGAAGGLARGLELQTDAVTRMTVTSAGNVGIGTSSPNYLFSVKTSSYAGQIGFSTFPGGGVGPTLYLENYGGTTAFKIGLDNSDTFRIKSPTNLDCFSSAGYFTSIAGNATLIEAGNGSSTIQNGQHRILLDPTAIQFFAGSTTTERMRILGSNGNVGIGTTNPLTPLHITSGVNSNIYLASNTNNDGTHEIRFGFHTLQSYAASIVGIRTGGGGRGNLEFRVAGGGDSTNAVQSDTALRITSTSVDIIKPIAYAQDIFAMGDNLNGGVKAFKFTRSENKAAIWSVPGGSQGRGDIRFTTGDEFVGTAKTESDATVIIARKGGLILGNSYISSQPTGGTLLVSDMVGIGTSAPLSKLDIAETWNSNISVTGASGTGSVATITFATQAAAIPVGATVVVSSVNPSGYNGTFVVTASSVTSVSYANATSTAYVSGGTVQQLFTAVKVNVTDTASNAGSNLLDLQVGGVSKFKVDKAGIVTGSQFNINGANNGLFGSGTFTDQLFIRSGNVDRMAFDNTQAFFIDNFGISTSRVNNPDVKFFRDAAGILAQRNGVSPQTSRIYGTYTDASNYARLAISCDTSGNAILATEGLGTGAAGTIKINGLPLGLGKGNVSTNVAIGSTALNSITTAGNNVAIGINALPLVTDSFNTAIGSNALANVTSGDSNTAVGYQAFFNGNGVGNVIIGKSAVSNLSLANNSVFIGSACTGANSASNQIVIGSSAAGIGSNSVVLGNDSILTTALKGNVGIGTTSPTGKLDVNGNVLVNGATQIIDSGNVLSVKGSTALSSKAGYIVMTSGDDLVTSYQGVVAGNHATPGAFFGSFTNSKVFIRTNNTERVTIDTSGNVGIGTLTPSQKLEVNGVIKSAYAGIHLGDPVYNLTVITPNSITYNSSLNHIFAGASTELMRLVYPGNLGLGTVSPVAKLDIVDTNLASSGSLAGSILNLAQTWNTTGAPTAIKLNVTNTASGAGSNLLDLQVGGVSQFAVKKGVIVGENYSSSTTFGVQTPYVSFGNFYGSGALCGSNNGLTLFSAPAGTSYVSIQQPLCTIVNTNSALAIGAAADTIILRDAANTLALRNGVNPQAFRLYNTYTDATTFERLNIKWDTNVLKIGTEKGASGGTARAMEFQTDGTIRMTFGATGGVSMPFSGGPLTVAADINGQRDIYCGSGRYFRFSGGGYTGLSSSALGVITLEDLSVVNLNPRINLGGTTSSFPAIKRNGAALQIRLADDSANAALETAGLTVVGSASVSGHFSAATKSFLIDHPTKEGKKLQYGVVESNQHSVLVRGKTAENIIELPEEWAGLVHEDSVTVQLTPIGSYQQLFVISQDNQRVVVGGSTGQYNYTIYGERKDVDKLITEI